MTKPTAMFWSGETLSERLKPLIDPFTPGRVDCAAYTLAIGPEIYVSPNDQTADPTSVTVRKLTEGEAFTIPPGQFAFLLTEEVVSVPADALAFISIRAKTKFRGLVNVSGFHVDPGYRGQLTFAVFNAGQNLRGPVPGDAGHRPLPVRGEPKALRRVPAADPGGAKELSYGDRRFLHHVRIRKRGLRCQTIPLSMSAT
jgi:hypothetical protein